MRSATSSSRPVGRRLGSGRTALLTLVGVGAAAALAIAAPATAEELPAEPTASSIGIEVTDCGTDLGEGSVELALDPCTTARADGDTAELPPTGAGDTAPLATAGALLVTGGLLMVLIRRRTPSRD